MKFYISFGQAHAHRINNRTFDCDSLLLVEAPDEISARIGMNTEISNRWCGIYKEEDLVDWLLSSGYTERYGTDCVSELEGRGRWASLMVGRRFQHPRTSRFKTA
jgi:hypothetical protein